MTPEGGPVARVGERGERRLAFLLLWPAGVLLIGLGLLPLAYTFWESLHVHDLRRPDLGRPFVGLAQYEQALGDGRFGEAVAHTAFFTASSLTLELAAGLGLALLLHRRFRGRGLARTLALVPWAIPTVVAALVWRFLFEGAGAPANQLGVALGLLDAPRVWLGEPLLAWVPLVLADVWKTTPFVALLLLAGLQSVDPTLEEAARLDGAGRLSVFRHVVWPALQPAFLVALVFRTLDALRVFDLVYVLTGGGPGTATETVALQVQGVLLGRLRFGYGSALSVLLFLGTLALALVYVRLVSPGREIAR